VFITLFVVPILYSLGEELRMRRRLKSVPPSALGDGAAEAAA
jgi:hypothetical protein